MYYGCDQWEGRLKRFTASDTISPLKLADTTALYRCLAYVRMHLRQLYAVIEMPIETVCTVGTMHYVHLTQCTCLIFSHLRHRSVSCLLIVSFICLP